MTNETRQLTTEEIALHCEADFQQLVDNSKAAAIRALTKRECIALDLSTNKTWALFVAILQCQSSGKPAQRFALISRANVKKIKAVARDYRAQTSGPIDGSMFDVGEFELMGLMQRDEVSMDMIETTGRLYPDGCAECTCFAGAMATIPSTQPH